MEDMSILHIRHTTKIYSYQIWIIMYNSKIYELCYNSYSIMASYLLKWVFAILMNDS
jgi:hypothetical protein